MFFVLQPGNELFEKRINSKIFKVKQICDLNKVRAKTNIQN